MAWLFGTVCNVTDNCCLITGDCDANANNFQHRLSHILDRHRQHCKASRIPHRDHHRAQTSLVHSALVMSAACSPFFFFFLVAYQTHTLVAGRKPSRAISVTRSMALSGVARCQLAVSISDYADWWQRLFLRNVSAPPVAVAAAFLLHYR